ncbi:MAG: hypothetical protein ACP5OP_09380, partial [Leptospirillia bacterium]
IIPFSIDSAASCPSLNVFWTCCTIVSFTVAYVDVCGLPCELGQTSSIFVVRQWKMGSFGFLFGISFHLHDHTDRLFLESGLGLDFVVVL